MSADYLEQLDVSALGLLAEATGVAARDDAARFFSEQPNGIRLALGSPDAVQLLDRTLPGEQAHRLLQIAVAVHRTAEDIFAAGWTARDQSPVDLPLLRFAGQGSYQKLMVELLGSFLPLEVPYGLDLTQLGDSRAPARPGSISRLHDLIDLIGRVGETERAGALRLLADEALFTAGVCPAPAAHHHIGEDELGAIDQVLPGAVRGLMEELGPSIKTQLDLYLRFGPVWYRMAAQDLIHLTMRSSLSDLAREFSNARRFLVRIVQGPLSSLHAEMFAVPC